MVSQFGLENAVEVLAAADGAERVAVRQLREHPNLVGVFELRASRHCSCCCCCCGGCCLLSAAAVCCAAAVEGLQAFR